MGQFTSEESLLKMATVDEGVMMSVGALLSADQNDKNILFYSDGGARRKKEQTKRSLQEERQDESPFYSMVGLAWTLLSTLFFIAFSFPRWCCDMTNGFLFEFACTSFDKNAF